MSTNKEKIASLFVAYFNRAPANNGFDGWVAQLDNAEKTYEEISAGFIEAKEFTDTYGTVDITNDASLTTFVAKVYQNVLGREGTTTGIQNQVEAIKAGGTYDGSLADFMAGFTASSLVTFDATEAKWDYLTAEQKTTATISNEKIINKVNVAINYSDILGDATNITSVVDGAVLYDEEARQSASNILKNVTDDTSTVTQALDLLNQVKLEVNPTQKLNLIQNVSKTIDTISTTSTFLTHGVASLDSGSYWNTPLNNIITYSFNTTIPTDYYDYAADSSLTQGWKPLSEEIQTATNTVMQDANQYIKTQLQEVSSSGMIQLNMLDMDEGTSGFSFMPDTTYDYGGDIFLNNDFTKIPKEYGLNKAEYGYTTILHELGHALGLKHPFEDANRLSVLEDDINHTIMSYTNQNNYVPILSFSNSKIFIDYNRLEPYSYSLYDVEALQAIYGVNTTTNKGDTTYKSSYQDYKLQTIWDAGGTDTIDLSTTTGSTTLDLRGGTLNSIDQKTLEDVISIHQETLVQNNKEEHTTWLADTLTNLYNDNNLYTGKNNFAIVQGTIIENINTGSGNDTITDNEVNNIINTGAGDDIIHLGNGGYDTINGGEGEDSIYLDMLSTDVTITSDDATYTLATSTFSATLIGIETIHYTNTTQTL